MKSADYKKLKVNPYAITRDIVQMDDQTGNIYKTVVVLSKRANQIASDLKEEFHERSQEFVSASDNLEEYHENLGQIELAKYFEQLPKPTLLAINEYQNKEIYFNDVESSVKTDE